MRDRYGCIGAIVNTGPDAVDKKKSMTLPRLSSIESHGELRKCLFLMLTGDR